MPLAPVVLLVHLRLYHRNTPDPFLGVALAQLPATLDLVFLRLHLERSYDMPEKIVSVAQLHFASRQ